MPHSCPMWSPTCGDSVYASDRGSWYPTALVSGVGVMAPLDANSRQRSRARSLGRSASGRSRTRLLIADDVAVVVCCTTAWPELERVSFTGVQGRSRRSRARRRVPERTGPNGGELQPWHVTTGTLAFPVTNCARG